MSDTAPSRAKVLWVAKGLGPGGMEQLLLHHAALGDTRRVQYQAAHLVPRPNSVVPKLEALGVRCHHIGGDDPRDPRWIARLVELVRRERFDVVHVHSPFVAALARPALRALPQRPGLVYTEHNSLDCYGIPTRIGDVATYPLDDVRFAVSTAAKESAPTRLGRRTEVLSHGVDVDGISQLRSARSEARVGLGIDDGQFLIGIVANLRHAKAYPVLLEAARRVIEQEPDARFVSLGQGPLEAELKHLHASLGLGDAFRFLGFTAEATKVMSALDVLTLSSDVEGMPVSVMEAKALGLPVVATSVGGLPEMITDGVDGLLVPRRSPDQLADALLRVLRDDSLRARLAAASSADAKRFDARVAISRQDDAYLALASRGHRSLT